MSSLSLRLRINEQEEPRARGCISSLPSSRFLPLVTCAPHPLPKGGPDIKGMFSGSHRGSLLWLCIRFHDTGSKSDIGTSRTGTISPGTNFTLASCKRGNLVHRFSPFPVSWMRRTRQGAYFSRFQIRAQRLSTCLNIRLYLRALVIKAGVFNRLQKGVILRNRVRNIKIFAKNNFLHPVVLAQKENKLIKRLTYTLSIGLRREISQQRPEIDATPANQSSASTQDGGKVNTSLGGPHARSLSRFL